MCKKIHHETHKSQGFRYADPLDRHKQNNARQLNGSTLDCVDIDRKKNDYQLRFQLLQHLMAKITLKILSCITTQPETNDSRSGNIDIQEMDLPCVAKLLIQMTSDNSRMISRGTMELISMTGISRILHSGVYYLKNLLIYARTPKQPT